MSANVMRNPTSKSERGPASRSIDTSPSSLPPLLRCDDLLRIRVVPISSPALGGADRLLFVFAPEADMDSALASGPQTPLTRYESYSY